ncbi:DUF6113 family protein [Streptomyces sp. ODS28]|uniref:DUF6113 family protein n=1 Tax=Streptomyces sp. ODS28 TaxID=3136688 RepID=UPI0031EEEA08
MSGGAGGAGDAKGAKGAGGAQGAQNAKGAASDAPATEAEREAMPPGTPRLRVLLYIGLGVLGLLVGAAGALVQAGWTPVGLVLAMAASVGVFWGGSKLSRTKVGAIAPGVGWTLAVALLMVSRPEGDFMFGGSISTFVYVWGGMLAAVMCATIALPAPPVLRGKYR